MIILNIKRLDIRHTIVCLPFFVVLLLCSCSNNNIVKDIEQLMDQQITLSSDWNTIWKGKDVVLNGFIEAPIKMMVWYDSLVCGACEVNKMHRWYNIVDYADSLSQWFSIIFLFSPTKESMSRLSMSLKAEKFDYPIFIDQNASFAKQNSKIPKNQNLHSFLLDKDNKVVLIGNPLNNPSLWRLYKRNIQNMIDHHD